MIEKSKHYNVSRLLSYQNADILMSIGGRGVGKTYGFKDYCIKRYLKKGEQFVYLRRNESELNNMGNFFSDLKEPYMKEYDFKIKGDKFLIKKKKAKEYNIIGYIMALTKIKGAKGAPFPLVGTILFDEFIISTKDKLAGRYLKGEVETLCDLYESIARERPVKLIMISNAIESSNLYFQTFNIKPIPKTITTHKIKLKDKINGEIVEDTFIIVLEMVEADEYIKEKVHTRSGKFMMASGMAESSLNNAFYRDNYNFIEAMPKKCEKSFIMNIKINDKIYGVYATNKRGDNGKNKVYVTKQYQSNSKRTYCSRIDDLTESVKYVKSGMEDPIMENLKIIVKNNMLYFQNLNIKNNIMGFLYDVNIL